MNLKVQLLATYTNICQGFALAGGGYTDIHYGLGGDGWYILKNKAMWMF